MAKTSSRRTAVTRRFAVVEIAVTGVVLLVAAVLFNRRQWRRFRAVRLVAFLPLLAATLVALALPFLWFWFGTDPASEGRRGSGTRRAGVPGSGSQRVLRGQVSSAVGRGRFIAEVPAREVRGPLGLPERARPAGRRPC